MDLWTCGLFGRSLSLEYPTYFRGLRAVIADGAGYKETPVGPQALVLRQVTIHDGIPLRRYRAKGQFTHSR
jgi:hypothetical protein